MVVYTLLKEHSIHPKNHLKSALKDIYKYDRHIKCLVYNSGGQNFSCAAEAVRELKAECPGIELCIVMPFLPLEDEYLKVLDKKQRDFATALLFPTPGWRRRAYILRYSGL